MPAPSSLMNAGHDEVVQRHVEEVMLVGVVEAGEHVGAEDALLRQLVGGGEHPDLVVGDGGMVRQMGHDGDEEDQRDRRPAPAPR